jgi:acyl-CoA thioester hydrolase
MEPESTKEHFAFFYALRVRWSEVDPQGIVFNPNYFVYADVAMTEYMRAIGYPYPDGLKQLGSDLFAIRAEADFLGSAVYDDELQLGARVEYIGRTSFRLLVAVLRGELLLAQIRNTYVHAALADKRPAPLPEILIARIEGFERTRPTRK